MARLGYLLLQVGELRVVDFLKMQGEELFMV
jgi:hypothetical protein